MIVTLDLLERLNACVRQREEFQRHFPNGQAQVGEEVCERYADLFDWLWCAENLLSREGFSEYLGEQHHAWSKLSTANAKAEQKSWAATQAAYNAHLHGDYSAETYRQWRAAERAAEPEYRAARQAAWREYKVACALAFSRLANEHPRPEWFPRNAAVGD